MSEGGHRGSLPRLDSLTGLRALAAAIVFGHHASAKKNVTPIAPWPSSRGQCDVSGLVLVWSRDAGDTARSFWRRRFARIYPAYIVALAGGFLVTSHYGGIADLRHLLPAVFTSF